MLAFAGAVVQRRMSAKPAGAAPDVLSGTVLVPTEAKDGVTVTPGRGRVLFVESTPEGAEVSLDGSMLGETPYSADFRCEEGKPAALEVKKAGYAAARFSLACANGSTRVSVKLKKR